MRLELWREWGIVGERRDYDPDLCKQWTRAATGSPLSRAGLASGFLHWSDASLKMPSQNNQSVEIRHLKHQELEANIPKTAVSPLLPLTLCTQRHSLPFPCLPMHPTFPPSPQATQISLDGCVLILGLPWAFVFCRMWTLIVKMMTTSG